MATTHLDDALIEEAQRDPLAFAHLVDRYQDGLYNFLYRMTGNREDAEDLAQDAFVRVYKALHRFRQGSPFRPWLYKIATNLAMNHFNARRNRTTVALIEEITTTSPLSSPEIMAELRETHSDVKRAILELPQTYRAVLLLRHVSDLPYDEIAATLELPVGTVKVRLHRARKLLQEKLAGRVPDDGKHDLHSSSKPTSALS